MEAARLAGCAGLSPGTQERQFVRIYRNPHRLTEVFVLIFLVIASCALLTAVLALALLREMRLRQALEALLKRILQMWRSFHGTRDPSAPRCDDDSHRSRDRQL
jgi:hypothetical protein